MGRIYWTRFIHGSPYLYPGILLVLYSPEVYELRQVHCPEYFSLLLAYALDLHPALFYTFRTVTCSIKSSIDHHTSFKSPDQRQID